MPDSVLAEAWQRTRERAVTFRKNKKNLFTARLAKRLASLAFIRSWKTTHEKRLATGMRRPTPNALLVILMPGAAWRRLYSLMLINRIIRRTVASS